MKNNAEYYIKCPNCKSKKIVSIAPYTYICNDCKQNFQIDEYKIREYLEDEYQEIDEDELNYMIQKACKSTK